MPASSFAPSRPPPSRRVERPALRLADRAQHHLRRQRQLGEPHADRVVDGVRDRRGDAERRRLAEALGAERAAALLGVDQQTLEARTYGVARQFKPLLLNTVVGFIGPEYLYDGKQIIRAGLEDHFCGKLLGLPMGVDVCYTNHAEADQDDMDSLLVLLAAAGVAYVIAVPGADDVMLGYQSLSFHDVLAARSMLGLRPAPEFESWLTTVGLGDERGRVRAVDPAGSALRQLTAVR